MSGPDQPSLRPANDNPWYCLATLHGEQPEDRFDQELNDKNRNAWYQWFGGINDVQRAEIEKDFDRRADRKFRPPEQTENPDFSHTHFVRRFSFEDFQFPRPSDFSSATFSVYADFSRARFQGSVAFNSATFSDANFSKAQFDHNVDFRSATFSGESNFYGANFSSEADFGSATFSGMASFSAAQFSNHVNFQSVTFPDHVNFRSARFGANANFPSTKFFGIADFSLATFSSFAVFSTATFSKTASFLSAAFSGIADFSSATFSSSVSFINTKFAALTNFANVRFERVPDFRGATMHEATEWHGATWPQPGRSPSDAQEQIYAYERLKQEMERQKKHEDELGFFRKELRARRGLTPFLSGSWLLNIIYQASSDYGNSFGRPLTWLFAVFAAGIAIFTHVPLCAGQTMPFKLAARLSFANIFVFLPDKRELIALPDMAACLSNWTAAVNAVQSLSGVVLLFFLGLALRNRFRMK